MDKRIFRFSKSLCDWSGDHAAAKAILGGKGQGLVMMAKNGLPVPPGFTITTDVCKTYMKAQAKGTLAQDWWQQLMAEVLDHDQYLTEEFGFAPLVSVRSGAPISMPGMMDTILNVGLTAQTIGEWAARLGNRAALDSYRRLIQMLGATAYGIPATVFEFQLAKIKKAAGAKSDTDLSVDNLHEVVAAFLYVFEQNKGFSFPQTRHEQIEAAVKAVFESWMNLRAIEYRKINKIDGAMGTACTVQAMVFGNMGNGSGTGVLFSRDPSTGEPGMMGEFLQNAQGEDVVAGIRTPMDVWDMNTVELQGTCWPGIYNQLTKLSEGLEQSYRDMVDIEFTVQQGELFVLQSRTGKRSARAAFRIAVDQVNEELIDRKMAFARLTVDQFKTVRKPSIDPKFKTAAKFTGLPACPGVASGKPVFSAEDAIVCNVPCVLVTHETNPNDIAGMVKAVGILTQTGGATSHAAVVARAMDKTCIVGCTGLDWEALKKADKVTIDGSTGRVWLNIDVPVIDSSDAPEVKAVMRWCLDDMEAYETSPVDLGADRPQRIMASAWWGSEDAMNAVLDGIAKLPTREFVVLDIRGPARFTPDCDAGLGACFGSIKADGFETILTKALKARATSLTGLQLVADDAHAPSQSKSVPLDYAAFTVLAR